MDSEKVPAEMQIESIGKGLRIIGATIAQINQLLNTPVSITYLGDMNYLGSDQILIMTRSRRQRDE